MNDFKIVCKELENIHEVYKGTDWLIIKKQVLKRIPSDIRSKFSTRDYLTKKHKINEFEKSLIEFYFDNYKIKLKLSKEEMQDENNTPIWQSKNN